MQIAQFAAKYSASGPHSPSANPDENRQLTVADGMFFISGAPFPVPVSLPGTPGQSEGRHLWVIRLQDLPAILEAAAQVQPPLQSGRAKHTNLTGGQPACCGGELWVDAVSECKLFVTGGSGRYWEQNQHNGPAKLADAARVFEFFGYEVVCAGWNTEIDMPERVFRE